MWFEAPGFLEKLKEWWESIQISGSPSWILWHKLKLLKDKIKDWLKSDFRKLETRISETKHAIASLDSLIEHTNLSAVQRAERASLNIELDKLESIKEKKWNQRREAIIEHITSFYSNLFSDDFNLRPSFDGINFDCLSPQESSYLEERFTEAEVLAALRAIHDGSQVSFWHDCWSGHRTLKEVAPTLYKISSNKNGSISDFITETPWDTKWNLFFNRDVRQQELQQLATLLQRIGTSPPTLDTSQDSFKWTLTTSGSFTSPPIIYSYTVNTPMQFGWKSSLAVDSVGPSRTPSQTLSMDGLVKDYHMLGRFSGALSQQQYHGQYGTSIIVEFLMEEHCLPMTSAFKSKLYCTFGS
ncbi:hypothetical protein BVC80_9049g17 [Macleaya cordata]|uniref:Uncharacterized protein n=1 Tax=Macleaya cordata TaxID=56857 RepID=A0A200R2G3_MACCD|nr:hypothetical protein BVC80_9049g17 [Macleaya cordata]